MVPVEAAHDAFLRQFTFNMLMISKIKKKKTVTGILHISSGFKAMHMVRLRSLHFKCTEQFCQSDPSCHISSGILNFVEILYSNSDVIDHKIATACLLSVLNCCMFSQCSVCCL
jgi:hypothetical protein